AELPTFMDADERAREERVSRSHRPRDEAVGKRERCLPFRAAIARSGVSCLGRVDHDPLLDAMLEETPRRVLDGLEDEPTFAAKLEARRSTGLDLVDDQVVRVRKRWSDDAAKAVGVLAHDIDRGE